MADDQHPVAAALYDLDTCHAICNAIKRRFFDIEEQTPQERLDRDELEPYLMEIADHAGYVGVRMLEARILLRIFGERHAVAVPPECDQTALPTEAAELPPLGEAQREPADQAFERIAAYLRKQIDAFNSDRRKDIVFDLLEHLRPEASYWPTLAYAIKTWHEGKGSLFRDDVQETLVALAVLAQIVRAWDSAALAQINAKEWTSVGWRALYLAGRIALEAHDDAKAGNIAAELREVHGVYEDIDAWFPLGHELRPFHIAMQPTLVADVDLPASWVDAVAFVPGDPVRIAFVLGDGTLALWMPEGAEELRTFATGVAAERLDVSSVAVTVEGPQIGDPEAAPVQYLVLFPESAGLSGKRLTNRILDWEEERSLAPHVNSLPERERKTFLQNYLSTSATVSQGLIPGDRRNPGYYRLQDVVRLGQLPPHVTYRRREDCHLKAASFYWTGKLRPFDSSMGNAYLLFGLDYDTATLYVRSQTTKTQYSFAVDRGVEAFAYSNSRLVLCGRGRAWLYT